jgi:hypothetical protein
VNGDRLHRLFTRFKVSEDLRSSCVTTDHSRALAQDADRQGIPEQLVLSLGYASTEQIRNFFEEHGDLIELRDLILILAHWRTFGEAQIHESLVPSLKKITFGEY